jgi:mitosis inhibitor protein kinase SWE1
VSIHYFGYGFDLKAEIGNQSEAFEPRRSHGQRKSGHHLHVVQGLFSSNDEEGRFENQFQVLGELGHGQFGVVLRVNDRLRNLEYAVKKSGRYEGVRHRYVFSVVGYIQPNQLTFRNRLREEVDVLKALTEHGGHANVLEYVDSWDEDDHLYIQTTLCPMGNLATFLNEYGKNFDRLEEAYIWKIMADVADVSRYNPCLLQIAEDRTWL